ncbi:MAG: LysE family transporter [Pseudomonadota bacterium]
MSGAAAAAPVLAVLAIGIVSPGPSFLVVARTAVAVSRTAAVACAFGMAAAAVLLATAPLAGLTALFEQLPTAYLVLKIAGSGYLLYLAAATWANAGAPIRVDSLAPVASGSVLRFMVSGAGTMLGNPKAAVQYGVIFSAMLPPSQAPWATLLAGIFLLEVSWYTFVAFVLSAPGTRRVYMRAKRPADQVVAAVLGGLGLRLLPWSG